MMLGNWFKVDAISEAFEKGIADALTKEIWENPYVRDVDSPRAFLDWMRGYCVAQQNIKQQKAGD